MGFPIYFRGTISVSIFSFHVVAKCNHNLPNFISQCVGPLLKSEDPKSVWALIAWKVPQQVKRGEPPSEGWTLH